MLIFKVFRRPEWDDFVENGRTLGAPVDRTDGFIHFSTAGQLEQTISRHFAGETDLVLMAMEVKSTGPWLKWEPSRGGQLFPHLYRDLEKSDVAWSRALVEDVATLVPHLEHLCD